MIIELLKKESENQYSAFIDEHPGSSIYHTLEWRHVIQDTYGYRPSYIVARDDNSIIGVLPLFEVNSIINGRRLVSIPFSHWVDILYNDTRTLSQMIDFAKHLTKKRKCGYIEIRHGSELPATAKLIRSEHFYDSILDISVSIDDIRDGFKKSVKRAIGKANRSSLVLFEGQNLEDYYTFYRLELETRKRQGAPSYSFGFFKTLYSVLYPKNNIKLYLASNEGKCIAGIIMLYHKQTAIYGYGASISNRELLNMRPNNLLFWQAIQDAHAQGYKYFDFGTTDPSNKGLLRFKSGWGTDDFRIPRYYYLNKTSNIPELDRDSFKMRVASGILKKMPICLTKHLFCALNIRTGRKIFVLSGA